MMSVLGPLSIDPNMLNTQKQQVQVGNLCEIHVEQVSMHVHTMREWIQTIEQEGKYIKENRRIMRT